MPKMAREIQHVAQGGGVGLEAKKSTWCPSIETQPILRRLVPATHTKGKSGLQSNDMGRADILTFFILLEAPNVTNPFN